MPPVYLIMIDGLRPDAIDPNRCPALVALLERSAYTLSARSIMPSITLPCHQSIFHSVDPSKHGITANEQLHGTPLPGLIEILYNAGKRCAFFYNWEPLRTVSQAGTLSLSYYRDNSYFLDGDESNIDDFLRLIARNNLDFGFIYLGNVDTAGHVYGWMSEGYLDQVARVDKALAALLRGLPVEAHVVLQADHGGHDQEHGTDLPEDMTIPWMVNGPTVRRNHQLSSEVTLLDTAPTIARLLGVQPPAEWEGRCIDEIFAM